MKTLFLILFACFFVNLNAQDTLIYKNGNVVPVKIISIDKKLSILKYVNGNDTILVSQDLIAETKFNSVLVEDELRVYERTDQKVKSKFSRFFFGNSNFNYGRFSFGMNPFAVFPSFQFSNGTLMIYGEFEPIKNFLSVRLPARVGFSNGSSYHERVNLLYETGVESIFYFLGLKKVSPYIKGGYYIGRVSYNVLNVYHTFLGYHPTDGYPLIERDDISESYDKDFNKICFGLGFQFNMLRSFSFGLEVLSCGGEQNNGGGYNSFVNYFYNYSDGTYYANPNNEYVLEESYPNIAANRFIAVNINVVYRFGGIRK